MLWINRRSSSYFAQSSDPFNLLFMMVSTVALLSIPIIPMCEGKFIEWRGKADKCLLWGSILVAGQALLMSIAIGFHDVPTEANILYNADYGAFSSQQQ